MAIIKVYSPSKLFTGKVGRVGFVNGAADVAEDLHASELAYFRRQGYQIGEPETDSDEVPVEDSSVEDTTPEVEIPGMPKHGASRGEFAEFAEGMGLETEGLTKNQIIDSIKSEANKQ